MCFIDASKAFDRVNLEKLFPKMRQRWVSEYIVRFQSMQVKWGNKVSVPFGVSNSVRQGGILSPDLYVDDLSKCFKACNTVCMIGNILVNYIMYADDLVVFSPSSAGLQ